MVASQRNLMGRVFAALRVPRAAGCRIRLALLGSSVAAGLLMSLTASVAIASSSPFTEVSGSPFAAGAGATAVAFNPSGSLLAVANSDANTGSAAAT